MHHRQPPLPHHPPSTHPTSPRQRPHPTNHQQWQATYAHRAGIEATIAQSVKTTDTRHARYHGIRKTTLEHA
ncbi:transposase, partial [Actinoplanes sp. DH11]|uniref:transposase n=1 Tax=Actinoplanes sp. DH11 TaxID=2857011 RepID=UPI0035ADABF4